MAMRPCYVSWQRTGVILGASGGGVTQRLQATMGVAVGGGGVLRQ